MTTDPALDRTTGGREAMLGDIARLSSGQGSHGGWGFGMAVRTRRADYAPVGQFGWFGGTGTTAYADRTNQLTGVLLTQVGLSTPDSPRVMSDFWTTLYQAVD
ncbi:hypothetical protein [Streptomyces narbonensis]